MDADTEAQKSLIENMKLPLGPKKRFARALVILKESSELSGRAPERSEPNKETEAPEENKGGDKEEIQEEENKGETKEEITGEPNE